MKRSLQQRSRSSCLWHALQQHNLLHFQVNKTNEFYFFLFTAYFYRLNINKKENLFKQIQSAKRPLLFSQPVGHCTLASIAILSHSHSLPKKK